MGVCNRFPHALSTRAGAEALVQAAAAYDVVSQEAMLTVLRDAPSVQAVLPFARVCCARESRYVWAAGARSHCILQAEAGKQCDSLMPAMFSLALQPALRAMQSELHWSSIVAAAHFRLKLQKPAVSRPRLPHLGRRSRIAPGRLAPVFLVRDLPCSTQAYAACHDTAVQRCLRPVTTGMADLGCAELPNTHLLRTRPPGLMSCAMSRRDAFSPATSLALSHCPLPGTPW